MPKIKEEKKIDFIIANGENTADGMGINKESFNELINLGVNVVTMGNHTWAKKDIFGFIDEPKLLRPANLPKDVVGKGYGIYDIADKKVAVINLLGRVDMGVLSENPFIEADNIIEKVKNEADIIIVDFHAEATAEKMAMAYYLDGRVTRSVWNTYTCANRR